MTTSDDVPAAEKNIFLIGAKRIFPIIKSQWIFAGGFTNQPDRPKFKLR
jgi:hypothetical protein